MRVVPYPAKMHNIEKIDTWAWQRRIGGPVICNRTPQTTTKDFTALLLIISTNMLAKMRKFYELIFVRN
jgi:hypothetical protein